MRSETWQALLARLFCAFFIRLRRFCDDDCRFGFAEGKRIRLSFRITKSAGAHLLETPLSTDQQVTDLGDWYEISATVVDTTQLQWWLRGFGDSVSDVWQRIS